MAISPVVEYPPRPLINWPTFGPKMPGLFGIGDRINALLVKAYRLEESDAALLAVEPLVGAPGLSDDDVRYLRTISGRPGEPVLAVPSDLLPESWQFQD